MTKFKTQYDDVEIAIFYVLQKKTSFVDSVSLLAPLIL